MTAAEIIARLGLEPLPGEGGYFRQTWVAPQRLAPGMPGVEVEKPVGTAIYYLVTDAVDGFSAMHRLPTDEVYHFYLGDPVEQLLLYPDGRSEVVVLGPDLAAGQHVQHVAPHGVWQGTRLVPGGQWALLGTTMAPGFDFSDYEPGSRDVLVSTYTSKAGLIRALTRESRS